jgi:hypothetical protein
VEAGIKSTLTYRKDGANLIGCKIYESTKGVQEGFVYLCTVDQLHQVWSSGARFVVAIGEEPTQAPPMGNTLLWLKDVSTLTQAANALQEVFAVYLTLERNINRILYGDGSLEDVSRIMLDHFQNPVFIHDDFFNILACPKWVEGMSMFTYNQQTGKFMQDMESINYFRASDEYKRTLVTKGGQMWLSGITDFKTMYANVWDDLRFRGRIVVNELDNTIKRSHLEEMGYFAELVRLLMIRRDRIHIREHHPFNNMVKDVLSGHKMDVEVMQNGIAALGWEVDQEYTCGLFTFTDEEVTRMSVYGICNGIEHSVKGSYTFYHEDQIYMIVNMTIGGVDRYGLRKKLSTIIREGILNVGLSNGFYDIFEIEMYFRQAKIALEYGQKTASTRWYHEFKNHVVQYWLTNGMGVFNKKSIGSPALQTLKSYDDQHHSELYQTLKVYLQQERNATSTAQLLNIHRSTLPHRLQRIEQLTQLDLNHHETRLYLNMSYEWLEEVKGG